MKSGKVKRAIWWSVAAIVAVTLGVFYLLSERPERIKQAVPAPPEIHLNEVLTNEMSRVKALEKMDAKVERYMQYWHVRGAQLAVTRGDSLLFCKGYGIADDGYGIPAAEIPPEMAKTPKTPAPMTPGTIMRVASVSKLVTAAGIMKLQEQGLLHLTDTVFGPRGILCDSTLNSFIKYPKDYGKITVEHLLRHQAGFRRDPVFSSCDVMSQFNLTTPPTLEDYSRAVLSRRLRYAPGTSQTYSNYGYMLLGRIIEKVSGTGYEDYIQTNVLRPAGCFDFHIARNYYQERYIGESKYFVHSGDGQQTREYNGSGNEVERCYGGNDIRLLGAAGAWVCSAAELARFVCSIDGNPLIEEILSRESVAAMTEYIDANTYSLGWNDTNPDKGWVRTGTLAGSNAVVKYFPDGECWIYISNTSTWKGPGHYKYTSTLFNSLREKFSSALPRQDLFHPDLSEVPPQSTIREE